MESKKCKEDLIYLVSKVLGSDNPAQNVWGAIHQKIADALSTLKNECLILIPRGHLKSTLVTQGWVIQQLLINPQLRVLIGSAEKKNAENFLAAIEDQICFNEKFKAIFGDIVLRDGTRAVDLTKETFTRTGHFMGHKEASVTIASVGMDKTSQHYDLIILDDIVNDKNTNSPDLRKKTSDFYKSCVDLLEPNGRIVLIGTRWHFGDLYNSFLDAHRKGKHTFDFVINESALINPNYTRSQFKAMMKDDKTTTLFPEKFGLKEIIKIYLKKRDDQAFSCQQMNHPMSAEGSPFKMEDIQFVDTLPSSVTTYICVDPAGGGTSDDADDFAIVVVGMDVNKDVYLIDAWAERVPIDIGLNTIATYFNIYHPRKVGIEKDFNATNATWLRDHHKELAKKLFEYRSQHVVNYKIKKMMGLSPYVCNGKFKILTHSNGTEYLYGEKSVKLTPAQDKCIWQMVDFNATPHDDVLDALSSTLEFVERPRITYIGDTKEYEPMDPITGW